MKMKSVFIILICLFISYPTYALFEKQTEWLQSSGESRRNGRSGISEVEDPGFYPTDAFSMKQAETWFQSSIESRAGGRPGIGGDEEPTTSDPSVSPAGDVSWIGVLSISLSYGVYVLRRKRNT